MSSYRLYGIVSSALFAFAGVSQAQTWSSEQQEILKLEEQQWQMSTAKDSTWIDKMVHPNLSAWEWGEVAPQDKASLVRWNKFESRSGRMLEHELYPIAVTITGTVAVVHYRYKVARENDRKERETATGRYTTVLVKEGGRWLYLSWSGGDDPKR